MGNPGGRNAPEPTVWDWLEENYGRALIRERLGGFFRVKGTRVRFDKRDGTFKLAGSRIVATSRHITVSPLGKAQTGVVNGGADFGPDTAGTSTFGIQEAMNFAKANLFGWVELLSGADFLPTAQITWPTGWSGIMTGQGAANTTNGPGAGSSDGTRVVAQAGVATSLLVLQTPGTRLNYWQMWNIAWDAGAVNLTATVDMSQTNENSIRALASRCVFDAGSGTTPTALIMDKTDDSLLFHCWAIGGTVQTKGTGAGNILHSQLALQWHSPTGGNKIVNGQYDGMDLSFQLSTHVNVTNNWAWYVDVGSAANGILSLKSCYRNGVVDGSNNTVPIVSCNRTGTNVDVDSCWFAINTAGGGSGGSFFKSADGTKFINLAMNSTFVQDSATNGAQSTLFDVSGALHTCTDFTSNLSPGHPNGTTPAPQFNLVGITKLSAGTPYTILFTDQTILVTTGAAEFDLNLPPAAGLSGRVITCIKADAGAGAMKVIPNGTDTIEGAASKSTAAQRGKIILVSDGTSIWYDLGTGLV